MLLIIAPLTFAKMGADAQLVWDANTEPDLAGYKIYYVESSKGWTDTSVRTIDVGLTTSILIRMLPNIPENVEIMFAATAYDDAGNESTFSAEQPREVFDFTPPAPPSGCKLVQR